jgi:uncharacterized YceG family protein
MTADDWLEGDPFADPDDPAAVERARRRAEREEKRRKRHGESAAKDETVAPAEPAPPARPSATPSPPVPRPPEAAPEPPPPPDARDEPQPQAPSEPPPPPEPPAEPPPDPAARARHTSDQVPAPAEDVGSGSVLSGDPLPPEERFWGPDEGTGQSPPRRGGDHRRFLRHPGRIALIVVGVLLLGFLWALFQPFHGDGSGDPFDVRIPKGSSVSEIGDLLGDRGVISSSTLFQIRVTLDGKRSELYPGNHRMREDMSYSSAIDVLSQPPIKKTLNVTIPEGLTRPQIATIAEQDGLSGDYLKDTVSFKGFDPNSYGAQGRARNLEGFLFPATYEMPKNPTTSDLVGRQLDAFDQNIKSVDMSYAKKKNLTTYDVLIIASMIEDEASPADFRNVAAVIYNRLRDGISLGIDATVRFAVGNYTQPLTQSELATDSPYNTRINKGLPPGPIGNPGLAAIRAAANPSNADYLYYVTKPGSCNRLSFSSTDAQFQRDVDAYNKARAAAGGNSPTNCG